MMIFIVSLAKQSMQYIMSTASYTFSVLLSDNALRCEVSPNFHAYPESKYGQRISHKMP